jgi:hypothetical protein
VRYRHNAEQKTPRDSSSPTGDAPVSESQKPKSEREHFEPPSAQADDPIFSRLYMTVSPAVSRIPARDISDAFDDQEVRTSKGLAETRG